MKGGLLGQGAWGIFVLSKEFTIKYHIFKSKWEKTHVFLAKCSILFSLLFFYFLVRIKRSEKSHGEMDR